LKDTNQYLYTSENDLSTRSLNIIKDLGGIPPLLSHYKNHQTFLNIRKSGVFTNNELISFCEYLCDHGLTTSSAIDHSSEIIEFPSNIDVELLSSLYLHQKDLLTTRPRNVLDSLENKYNYSIGQAQKILFFKKHFVANFDFIQLGNVGANSAKELTQFTETLRAYILGTASDSADLHKSLTVKQLSKLFDYHYNPELIELIVNRDQYHFQRTLCILLHTVPLTNKKRQILDYLFFDSSSYSVKELAKIIGCSYQLVRVNTDFLNDEFIPTKINSISLGISATPFDLPNAAEKLYIEIPNIEHFEFNGRLITPNPTLSKLAFRLIFKDNLILVDDILKELLIEINSFDVTQANIFINPEFVKKSHLAQLLQFLNTEIYNFEIVSFEYDLKILIMRFYRENDLAVLSRDEIETLYRIILRIRNSEFLIQRMDLKRTAKKERTNHILKIAEELLKEASTPVKTQILLNAINDNGIEIDVHQLLHKLGKHKNTFIRLGNSLWGLKERDQIDELRGSLREIAEDILQKKDMPIHISELIAIIEKMRPISLLSLNSNLRASESKMFKFFNCSFIGLSLKKYEQYWYDIPRFTPAYLRKEQILLGSKANDIDLAERMHSRYGYPKMHVEYVLSNRTKIDENL